MLALKVNETKVDSSNAFIIILFALESEKESKNDEGTLFWDCPRSLDLSLNPLRNSIDVIDNRRVIDKSFKNI